MSRDLVDSDYYITHGGQIPVRWTAPEVSDVHMSGRGGVGGGRGKLELEVVKQCRQVGHRARVGM